MKHINAFGAIIIALIVMAVFIAFYTVFGVEPPKQVAYVLLLGVSVGISISWGPAAFKAIGRGAADDRSKIVLTIWLSWTALIALAVYVNATFALKRPVWLLESPASLVVAVLMLIAGTYALVAPATGDMVPRREKIWTTLAFGAGCLVVGSALTLMYIYGFRNIFSIVD